MTTEIQQVEQQDEVSDLMQAAPQYASEIDIQIQTAKSYPRSIGQFKKVARGMATLDIDTASECFYVLPRGDKQIEGPSARLAEIIAIAWGNLRYGAKPVGIERHATGEVIVAEGVCLDLETNVAGTIRHSRRITYKNGKRYNDDMIAMTANAACSIAVRNAILKIIPKAFWQPIYKECRAVVAGTENTLAERRSKAFEYFTGLGIDQSRVLAVLGKQDYEDVETQDMITLHGLATAIKDGDISVDNAFPKEGGEPLPTENGGDRRMKLNRKDKEPEMKA